MSFCTYKETATMGSYLTNAEPLEARPSQVAFKRVSPSEHLSRILVAGVVLILPIIVIVYSKFPLYNPVGYLDPWFYTGYFNNLGELYKWFGPTYYLSRLPWIVPGYIAYHLLPAKWAYFALHGCFLYLGGIFTYLLLRSRYDRFVGSSVMRCWWLTLSILCPRVGSTWTARA